VFDILKIICLSYDTIDNRDYTPSSTKQDNNISTMTNISAVLSIALLFSGASGLAPSNVPKASKPSFDVQRIAVNSMAAASLASALVVGPMADAVETMDLPSFGSSSLVAERVTREGLYREYDVDVGDQVYDDARSTYKSAKETKTKKGMHAYQLCLW
ncbi:hypothetical protein ACHAWX_000441, partial [Stephanocyclus meneghinianus]